MSSQLRLEQISPENVEMARTVTVSPSQQSLVSPVSQSLAEASEYPHIAWPRLIFAGQQPVGFVMGFVGVQFEADPIGTLRSGLWRLNISAGNQRRGYGRFAVRAVCAEIQNRGYSRATATWVPGEHGPERFYQQLGFYLTGETVEDEVIGALDLVPTSAPGSDHS